jgi:RalA-binding protein 1
MTVTHVVTNVQGALPKTPDNVKPTGAQFERSPGQSSPEPTTPRTTARKKPVPLSLGGALTSTAGPITATRTGDATEGAEALDSDRGRRRTRQEDDHLREQIANSRSRSKKTSSTPPVEAAPSIPEIKETLSKSQPSLEKPVRQIKALHPGNLFGNVDATPDIGSVLGNNSSASSPASISGSAIRHRTLMAGPLSPGLPLSPRPGDRPPNGALATKTSPPLSPRFAGGLPLSPRLPIGLPMSPRALKHTFGAAPGTPSSTASFGSNVANAASPQGNLTATPGNKVQASQIDIPAKQIYRGLVSEQYPGLMLPPNALPLIRVRVFSSIMKRSQANIASKKAQSVDEAEIFTLTISFRSNRQELWRVEKDASSLTELTAKLKELSEFNAAAPDGDMFSGSSPAKVDARREALEQYFEAILDTPMDDKAATAVCSYLSTNVLDPEAKGSPIAISTEQTEKLPGRKSGARPSKDGYLTKRGKNYGGWTTRYFVLENGVLKYHESPGGSLLGIIKLYGAQIGKQSPNQSQNDEDPEKEYRHAFLILEPKKKDSTSTVRHVLCAENDTERDSWVETLLCYVDLQIEDEERISPASTQSPASTHLRPGSRAAALQNPSPSSDNSADRYRSTTPTNDESVSSAAFPAVPTPQTYTPSGGEHRDSPTGFNSNSGNSRSISGPTAGAKITNVQSWGNIAPPSDAKKKSKFWGFRGRNASTDIEKITPSNQLQPPARNYDGKAVFGLSLQEAVDCCPPHGVDIYLPAVVYRCIEYLDAKDAASEEGIFRMSGSNLVIKALKDRFNQEGDVRLIDHDAYYDVHAIASLLKLYLRELPQTILTRELHLDFLSTLEIANKNEKLAVLRVLVRRLPRANRTLIQAVSAYLIQIISNNSVNKMTIRNVGIVFSPTLNIPAPLFSLFLQDFDSIFDDGEAESPVDNSIPAPPDRPAPQIVRQELSMDDIRSPRRQMFQDLPTPLKEDKFPANIQDPYAHAPLSPRSTVGFSGMQNSSGGFQQSSHNIYPSQPQSRFLQPQGANVSNGHKPYNVVQQVDEERDFGSLNAAFGNGTGR